MQQQLRGEQGAAAVEFALVLPVLVLLLCGIVDFGRAYNARITLSHAAREAARVWALGGTADQTTARARSTATGLSGVTATTTTCTFGQLTSVTVKASFGFATPLIADLAPGLSSLSAEGVMRCGG